MAWYGDLGNDLMDAGGGALAGAAVGGPLGAVIGGGAGLLYGMYSQHKANDVANKYKADLTAATAGNDARMAKLKQFYLDQQKQAQGYYAPVQHMYQSYYGTNGVQAPQVPHAPGVSSLGQMYGGG
jgi:hypothetical protein